MLVFGEHCWISGRYSTVHEQPGAVSFPSREAGAIVHLRGGEIRLHHTTHAA